MTYFIERFKREYDSGSPLSLVGAALESDTRDGLSLKISEYFGVSVDSLEYSGSEVIVTVFEDAYGFRVDTKEQGMVVEYAGVLMYQGQVDWQDAERAISINGSECNR